MAELCREDHDPSRLPFVLHHIIHGVSEGAVISSAQKSGPTYVLGDFNARVQKREEGNIYI
eukprot:12753932-Prorocentrum_lima.AAC.1